MSTVIELSEIGTSIVLSGDNLLTFIREQQAIKCDERAKAHEAAKEIQAQTQEHEKELIELKKEAELTIKQVEHEIAQLKNAKARDGADGESDAKTTVSGILKVAECQSCHILSFKNRDVKNTALYVMK